MRGLLAVIVLLGASCAQTPPLEGPTPLALVGARLIDGTDAPPIDNAVVLIQGERILAAGPRSAVRLPPNAEVIDVAGKHIMPGLIDLHVHYAPPPDQMPRILGAQLALGVTAARSIGTDDDARLEVLRRAREGAFPAPDVWTAGLGFTAPGGHPIDQLDVHRPSTPDEARALVRELVARRVDFVKMWVDSKYGSLPKIPLGIREAVAHEAVEHLLPAVAHIFDEADVYHLAELGVTDFLHSVRDKEPMDGKFLDYARSKGLWFTPTLTVIESSWLFAENPALLEGDQEARAATSTEALAQIRDPEVRARRLAARRWTSSSPSWSARSASSGRSTPPESMSARLRQQRRLDPGRLGTHNELRLLVAAGLTPHQALLAGTARGAMRLGVDAERGRLVPGYRADLLVLDADPLADINNSRSIARVMQAGRWVDREALLR